MKSFASGNAHSTVDSLRGIDEMNMGLFLLIGYLPHNDV